MKMVPSSSVHISIKLFLSWRMNSIASVQYVSNFYEMLENHVFNSNPVYFFLWRNVMLSKSFVLSAKDASFVLFRYICINVFVSLLTFLTLPFRPLKTWKDRWTTKGHRHRNLSSKTLLDRFARYHVWSRRNGTGALLCEGIETVAVKNEGVDHPTQSHAGRRHRSTQGTQAAQVFLPLWLGDVSVVRCL